MGGRLGRLVDAVAVAETLPVDAAHEQGVDEVVVERAATGGRVRTAGGQGGLDLETTVLGAGLGQVDD
ncbi:hypothetical protein PV343_06515 [Streptomyces sp. WI03-4A]|uniref:hypothetical protein n=1 Tax=Streptomyces sp. WI03-4A TaxID=3028706 RepID=UPI0029B58F04|nr:hypothetical protein [Streptomyces sp. WI03-4A]MDX2591924.1 hypothetical protein [Streptomyces sp. WI03-4A]